MTRTTSAVPSVSERVRLDGWRARIGLVTPVNVVVVVATLAALALRVTQLSNPHYLLGVTEYDDGVYFGSAVRFVHGVLPYRDFAMVQPPGIVLLMTPAALASKVVGTAWGMAAGRIMTALASTVSVTLACLIVRHRGPLATAVTGGIMAVYRPNLADAHTVLVEPWLTLFVLISVLAVYDGDRPTTSRRRLAWGGAAAGFAGAVEVWAIFPVLVMIALMLLTSPADRSPRASPGRFAAPGWFGAGVTAGFLAPVLPFAAVAARSMYQSIVASQMGRVLPARTGLWFRLQWLTGTADEWNLGHVGLMVLALAPVAVVVAALVLGWVLTGSPSPALDWFAVATAAAVVAAFLWNKQFFLHFPAYLAPFLAMSLALPAARVSAAVRQRSTGRRIRAPGPWTSAGLAAVVIVVATVAQAGMVSGLKPVVSPAAVIEARHLFPRGACVFTDQASYLIAADRFTSKVPGCSQMVDPLEVGYSLGHGREGDTGAARYPAVAAVFRDALTHAGYAWLTFGYDSRRVAWTPALRRYFRRNFVAVYTDRTRDVLYVRRAPR